MTPAQRSSAWFVTGVLMIGLMVGRSLPPLIVRMGSEVPVPDWTPAVVLVLGGVVVAGIAWQTWRSLHRDKKTIASRHAIRVLAIAKSAIIVGAVFAGGYFGFALAFFGVESELGELRFWRGLVAGLAGLLLLGAAFALEWTCKLPDDDDEEADTVQSKNDPSPA